MNLVLVDEPEVEVPGRLQRLWGVVRSRTGLLLIVALLFAASGAVAWWLASQSEALQLAQSRETVLEVASTHIETLNTLDHRDIDGGLKSWAAATTGVLHDQVSSVPETDKEALAAAKKVTEGKVVDAAVLDLDTNRGVATVIAAVEVHVTDDKGETSVKRNRFSADVVLVKGEWLLETLQQVAVDL